MAAESAKGSRKSVSIDLSGQGATGDSTVSTRARIVTDKDDGIAVISAVRAEEDCSPQHCDSGMRRQPHGHLLAELGAVRRSRSRKDLDQIDG